MSSKEHGHYERGLALKEQGAFVEAITNFLLAIQEDPRHALAHQELALLFYREGDASRTEEHATRALELQPSLVIADLALCMSLASMGRDEAAEARYKALLARARTPMVLNSYGKFLWRHGRAEESERYLTEAVELDPTFAPAIRSRAVALAELDRDAEADAAFQRALELDPADVYTHYMYGWLLAQFEDREGEARKHLMKCRLARRKARNGVADQAARTSQSFVRLRKLLNSI